VKDAEIFLLITTVVIPPTLGIAAAILRKPWWWAAALGVVIAMIAVVAPTPEAGESRLTSGDLPFLLMVALWVTGLVWLANYLAIRFWVRRRPPEAAARP
jgi:type VI protein secretion system component VasK